MSDRDECPPKQATPGPDEDRQAESKGSQADRGRTLLQLCYLDLAEERLREAVSMMNRAERLGADSSSLGPPTPRQANEEGLPPPAKAGNAKALQSLSSLLDQARSLSTGSFRESGPSAEEAFDDLQWIAWLADQTLLLLAARMDCAAADVRQAREDCQPWLEKVLAALLRAAKKVGEQKGPGQRLLVKAWTVLMCSRNPELHCATRRYASDRRSGTLSQAEQAFYSALHCELLKGRSANPQGWNKALRRLQESLSRRPAPPLIDSPLEPPRQGVSLAFFLFRNLFPDAVLLVLASREGKLHPRLISEAQSGLIPDLLEWRRRLFTDPPSVPERGAAPSTPRPSLQDLLPRGLSSQPGTLSPGPWSLFPEGIFCALPLEMLPDGQGTYLGQRREVHICLSRRPAEGARRRVDWERGWLAVGAAPGAGRMPELAGARDEVRALERLISQRKFPAQVLAGSQAHLSNLRKRLKKGRHSVLHLAVQGYSDARDPEACTLVLAGIPGVRQSELLPFGKINRMDLRQLDLVVLSATAGWEAEAQSASAVEGLIGAFLGAGAGQVIARRYPVDPTAARLFLLSLYRQLFKHPAALALGLARHECLGRLGLSQQQVGAWSIWN